MGYCGNKLRPCVVVRGMTLHLTYTYLWVLLGILWLVGVAVGNAFLSYGEVIWWERVMVLAWPVAVPVLALYIFGKELFWP